MSSEEILLNPADVEVLRLVEELSSPSYNRASHGLVTLVESLAHHQDTEVTDALPLVAKLSGRTEETDDDADEDGGGDDEVAVEQQPDQADRQEPCTEPRKRYVATELGVKVHPKAPADMANFLIKVMPSQLSSDEILNLSSVNLSILASLVIGICASRSRKTGALAAQKALIERNIGLYGEPQDVGVLARARARTYQEIRNTRSQFVARVKKHLTEDELIKLLDIVEEADATAIFREIDAYSLAK